MPRTAGPRRRARRWPGPSPTPWCSSRRSQRRVPGPPAHRARRAGDAGGDRGRRARRPRRPAGGLRRRLRQRRRRRRRAVRRRLAAVPLGRQHRARRHRAGRPPRRRRSRSLRDRPSPDAPAAAGPPGRVPGHRDGATPTDGAERHPAAVAVDRSPAPSGAAASVLVADDYFANQRLVTRLLERRGYVVEAVERRPGGGRRGARSALRRRADGLQHAGAGRLRRDRADPRPRTRPAAADPGDDGQRLGRGSRHLPARRHGRLPGQADPGGDRPGRDRALVGGRAPARRPGPGRRSGGSR